MLVSIFLASEVFVSNKSLDAKLHSFTPHTPFEMDGWMVMVLFLTE